MFLEEMTEVQKHSVICEGNQGAIFLANNSQVGLRTKDIDICRYFLRNMVEDKYIDIQYIRSEDNPTYIMTKNTLVEDFSIHMKRVLEGGLWKFVYTGSYNVKNSRVTGDVFNCDKTKYSSHTLAEVVD